MSSLIDVCRFNATSSGTGDFVVSSAATGYQTPASAGAVNGATYSYRAENPSLSEWEVGFGTYTTGTTALARSTVLYNSLGTTAKINFSTAPQVAVVALAADIYKVQVPQGRLTLATATPVMVTTQASKTTIYYTPYVGNLVPLYDGTNMNPTPSAEISVATTDTAKNPAAIGANKVNDWFIWNDAGTLRLTHGPDWTSDTARSAGTALVMINGIYLNNASITNGPAASRGTYVGTTRSDASSQLNFVFGSPASGGGMALLHVWNAYNRLPVSTTVADTSSAWTYATATWRAANNSSTMRVNYVVGLSEDPVAGDYGGLVSQAGSVHGVIGVGLDTTTSFSGQNAGVGSTATGAAYSWAKYRGYPGIGAHFLSALEYASGATATYYGNAGVSFIQSGFIVELKM